MMYCKKCNKIWLSNTATCRHEELIKVYSNHYGKYHELVKAMRTNDQGIRYIDLNNRTADQLLRIIDVFHSVNKYEF